MNKIYKRYASYEAAYHGWDGFLKTGYLPADVAMTLGSNLYLTPPAILVPSRLPAPPSTPQCGHHTSASSFVPSSPTLTQSPHAPYSIPGVSALFGPSSCTVIYAGNQLNTV
jgi:hypothetical protein